MLPIYVARARYRKPFLSTLVAKVFLCTGVVANRTGKVSSRNGRTQSPGARISNGRNMLVQSSRNSKVAKRLVRCSRGCWPYVDRWGPILGPYLGNLRSDCIVSLDASLLTIL